MGGKSPSATTVTNKTEVDPVTNAWRQQIMGAGSALYNQGTPNYYPGSTVTPFSNQTQGGLDYLQGQAQAGAPNLDAANQAAYRGLSGYNPAMGGAMEAAGGGLDNQMLGGLQQFGGGTNPALDNLFAQGSRQVADSVNSQFAQSGRFGSNAAHTGALSRGMNDLYGQIYAPAYEAERNRGLQAAGQMAGYGDSNANRRLQGSGLASNMWSQGNQDASRSQALLGSLYQYGQQPGQAMLDVGSMYENQAGQYLADDQARYDYQANAPWDYLGRYSAAVNGLPDFSGQSSRTQGPGPNRVMSGLGGAASGASLGSSFGPWGTAIGAAVGGLWGGFG